MQKCGDSGFCKRLRGNKGDVFEVNQKSVRVENAKLHATLVNTAAQKDLNLVLSAYNGLVRLVVDEAASSRFQV